MAFSTRTYRVPVIDVTTPFLAKVAKYAALECAAGGGQTRGDTTTAPAGFIDATWFGDAALWSVLDADSSCTRLT